MSEFGVSIDLLYFTHNVKHHQNSKKMALQGAVGALEAYLPTSCPALPYYSISSISKGYKLYESLLNFPRGRDSHDLLRQQSENSFWRSKNRWILRFSGVFHVFLDFSIFHDFGRFWWSDSDSRRNFLPGDGFGSPESQFSVTSRIFIMNEFFLEKYHPNSDLVSLSATSRCFCWTWDASRIVDFLL